MTAPYGEWLERVQSAVTAPLLPSDESGGAWKWAVGDALLAVPEEHRDSIAEATGLKKNNARSYWRTAAAWPLETRETKASWTVYRDLARSEDRFQIISPGMTVRDNATRIGREIDRRAVKKVSDPDLVDEIVRIMLSPRSRSLVPEILERLNSSKEGRKAARDRRSTGALRKLDEEIRLIQKEIKKRRGEKSPRLRFMEVRRRLLDTEVNVEEIGLLVNDPDDRHASDEEDWRDLAERLCQLRDAADKVATSITDRFEILDVEAWSPATDGWTMKELSGGDDDPVDAEIVDVD